MKNKNGISFREMIIVVIVTSIITSLTTGVIMYNNSRITRNISGNDLSQDVDLEEFLKVYASLVGDYYDDIDKKAMLEKAMQSMFEYLGEDYTNYLNKNETDALAEKLLGRYRGIGVQIIEGNFIYSVFEDTPASSVGLLVGDKIISVNHENVEEKTTSEVSSLIQASNDILYLTVKRNEEFFDFEIPVKTLLVPAIDYNMVPDNDQKIGYLRIATFSNTVSEQVQKALSFLEEQGMQSLIVDVRSNTGGYLSAATDIASMFLEKEKVLYSLASKNETVVYKDETEEHRSYPIIVLMDEGTASASEILAAALKDSYGAMLVGEKSYGKGKVQQTKGLEDGSMVKYTTARWLRPNGDCIDGIGLEPDVFIDSFENLEEDDDVDEAYQEAIRILSEQ